MASKRSGQGAGLAGSARAAVRSPALTRVAEGLIRFFLGAILAGGGLPDGQGMGCSPFGVGFTAASGAGVDGLCALAGTVLGCLWAYGVAGGIRWAAAAVLVYSLAFAFWDAGASRWGWFLPAAAAAMDAVTGFVYLSDWDWRGERVALFAAEAALCALSAQLYAAALSSWRSGRERLALSRRQSLGAAYLGVTVLMALARAEITAGVSLGRGLTAALVMALARLGGAGWGAASGVCLGLAMDLAAGGAPFYAVAYGLAGLLMGSARRQGRLFGVMAFVTAHAAVILWSWDPLRMGGIYEALGGAALFLAVPEKRLRRVWALLVREETRPAAGGAALLARRLADTAGAFRDLGAALRASLPPAEPNDADPASLLRRAADRVCRSCALRGLCWERECQNTLDAWNNALPAILDRGRGEAGDLPRWFASRCVSLPALLSAVDREAAALRYRRQYRNRVRESRGTVTRQYETLARVLTAASAELGAELVPDPVRERRVRSWLAGQDLEGRAAVYYDPAGRLRLEITGLPQGTEIPEEALGRLSALVGLPLRREEGEEGLVLVQAEPLMAVAGAAARRREGQRESGDTGTWFKREDGSLFVLLCDGMGSGPEARRESALAVRLLERFLLAGVESPSAMGTVNGGLTLKNEESGAFSTVDLLRVDLYTGRGELCKLGAAPTYLRQGGRVSRITGSALPAGLADGDAGPDVTPLELQAGDWVVMLSDGVADSEDDGWVRELLESFEGTSPRDLARRLMEGSEARVGASDDRTAVVVTLKKRQ